MRCASLHSSGVGCAKSGKGEALANWAKDLSLRDWRSPAAVPFFDLALGFDGEASDAGEGGGDDNEVEVDVDDGDARPASSESPPSALTFFLGFASVSGFGAARFREDGDLMDFTGDSSSCLIEVPPFVGCFFAPGDFFNVSFVTVLELLVTLLGTEAAAEVVFDILTASSFTASARLFRIADDWKEVLQSPNSFVRNIYYEQRVKMVMS